MNRDFLNTHTVQIEQNIRNNNSTINGYTYPGEPRLAITDVDLSPRDPLIGSTQDITNLTENISLTLRDIPISEIVSRISGSSIHNSNYVADQLQIVNNMLVSRSENLEVVNASNFLNFRFLIHETRFSNTHDLGLTSFFELIGDGLTTVFQNIVSDPNLVNGLGIYIIVFTFERLLTRIVFRPNLTIRSLITILRGSLINARRRITNSNVLVRNVLTDTLWRSYHFVIDRTRGILRVYYHNGFSLRFLRDLTIVTLITTGINRFRSIRF